MLRESLLARRFRGVEPLLGLAVAAAGVTLRVAAAAVIGSGAPYAFNAFTVLLASLLAGWVAGLAAVVFGVPATGLLLFGPALRQGDSFIGLLSAAVAQSLFVLIVHVYQRRIDAETTELKRAQKALVESSRRQQALIGELNHRVKNTLMIVQSLAKQTFGANPPPEAVGAFEGRLAALARARDTLTEMSWARATLEKVIIGALDGCGVSGRVAVRCPLLYVEPRTAVTMTMAVHELCTNALKYGALSVPNGRVTLECDLASAGGARLRMCWRETGGPEVRAPERRGFGTRMLERALAGEFEAEVDLDFKPSGLVCTIEARNIDLFQKAPPSVADGGR